MSERSEFFPSPPCDTNSRRGSPHRARLSLLTFFGKTKKVSRPRQGVKQGMHQEQKTKTQKPNHEAKGFLAANNPFNAPNRSFGDIAGIVSSGVGPASSPSFISAI